MTGRIYVGPAGWSYPDWNGSVYPVKQKEGFDPLAFISCYFNLVELNNTFYRIPGQGTVRGWVRRIAGTPDFLFTVKAFRNFTHGSGPLLQSEIEAFKSAISPVLSEGRLGAVLLQFPWSFRYSRDTRQHVERLTKSLNPFPLAVEVRHGSWGSEDAVDFIRSTEATLCGIDQPLIGHSLTPKTHLAGRSGAYFRLHGRNTAKWFGPDTTRDERYNYLYSKDELSLWAKKITLTSETIDRIFIVLNNHFRGQAVANALELKSLLSGETVRAPESLLRAFPRLRSIASTPAGEGPGSPEPPAQGELFNRNSPFQENDE